MSWYTDETGTSWSTFLAALDAHFDGASAKLISTPTLVCKGKARGGAAVVLREGGYFRFEEDLRWADKEARVKKRVGKVELDWVKLKGLE